jgi:delta14-sterol reductase
MGITFGVIFRYGPQSFTFFYDKWVGFTTAAILMSIVQSFTCYAMSFQEGKLLALGGNSGNFIYDVSSSPNNYNIWFLNHDAHSSS